MKTIEDKSTRIQELIQKYQISQQLSDFLKQGKTSKNDKLHYSINEALRELILVQGVMQNDNRYGTPSTRYKKFPELEEILFRSGVKLPC